MKFSGSRALVAVFFGLATALIVYGGWLHSALPHPDLWEPWLGAKSLMSRVDPYPLVGPGRQYANEFLFIYPLTASVVVLPLAGFSVIAASSIFVGISSALLAYAVTKDGWHRLALFLSMPFAAAAWGGQWSILFSAAFLLPGLAWAYAAKPSIAAALLLATWSRRTWLIAIVGGVALGLAAMVIVPQWPAEWIRAITSGTVHMTAPIIRPGGFVALLALLRWRRPEARMIFLLSLVPQTALWYEAVPLLLVPKSLRETLALSILTSLPILYEANFGLGDGSFDVYPRGVQLALFAYLPAVTMVLMRPNEGKIPAWLGLTGKRKAEQREAVA